MSDAVLLAIINNLGNWITGVVGLIGAVAGVWSLVASRRTNATAKEAKALAQHAQDEMVDVRQEGRELFDFIRTDVFNARVKEARESGRPPLHTMEDDWR